MTEHGHISSAPGASRQSRPPRVAGAERFAARSRRRRWQRRRPRLIALAAAVVVVAMAYVVEVSPLLGVRSVTVIGTSRLSASAVRAAAQVPAGRPLARLDSAGIADKVTDELPAVRTVGVQRRWPGTVHLVVTERTAVATVPRNGGVALVDADGVAFADAATAPAGLPGLVLPPHPSAADRHAALTVIAALPPATEAASVAVSDDGSVSIALADGRKVLWGTPDESEVKASVLAALLPRPAQVYDVSTPELVTTR